MDFVRHDLGHAFRSLRRGRSFTAVAVVTLALGAAVLTALLAIVRAVLLVPVAVDQERVVRIWKHETDTGLERQPFSYPEFLDSRAHAASFQSLAAINYADASAAPIDIDGRPARVWVTPVSSDFFSVLHGGGPALGRWLEPADERPGAGMAGVVSQRFWRRVAGGDPSFVGRRLRWAGGGRSILIVGIAPATLDYPVGTDMWVPIATFFETTAQAHIDLTSRRSSQFELVGRLRGGASPAQARAELEVVQRRLGTAFPKDHEARPVVVVPVLDTVVGSIRLILVFLFAAGALVFVIAGVNVATLLLMRASTRRREIAVRVALGATGARLARQAIAEALLLGVLGAAGGLLFANLLLALVRWLALTEVPRLDAVTLTPEVALFCVAAVLAWVLLLGAAPMWWRGLFGTLDPRDSSSWRSTRTTRGLRVFAVVEIAAAVVVAAGAGLLVRSYANLQGIERGFPSGNLAVMGLLLPELRYPDPSSRLRVYNQLVERVAAVPGVIAATALHVRPGTGSAGLSARLTFEGQTDADAERNPWANWEPVMPDYFRTIGIPIVRGRGFTDADRQDSTPVAVVSEAAARRYWPGQNPLGKKVRFSSGFEWATVVGVAADVRYRELTRTWLSVYFPAAQFFFFSPGSLVVRTAPPPESLVPAIRDAIGMVEPDVPLDQVTTMDAQLQRELAYPRAAFAVSALFAVLAVLLAAIGVYGVLSFDVGERRRELAVRVALGAGARDIFRIVTARSLALAAAGAIIGTAAALLLTRSLESWLYGVRPADPIVLVAAAASLAGVVVGASAFPARRAARVDPMIVLRAE